MARLLHIVASPRKAKSRTLKVSEEFLHSLPKNENWEIDTLDLSKEELPDIFNEDAGGKYSLLQGNDPKIQIWRKMKAIIDRFLAADAFLISTPMWNFQIPYKLKHYIDIMVQPGLLFKFTPNGPEGLVKNKPMVIICSSGGDYRSNMKPYNFVEPYLRTIFGFVGITDIQFLQAQPMDLGPELESKALLSAKEEAKKLAGKLKRHLS